MLAHPVAQNTLSLYVVQFANMFLPLLLIPYLARVLLPESFGLYVFFYSLSVWIYAFIEYGFNLSATREISRERDNKQRVAEIAANVIGGQVILAIAIIFFAMCLSISFFPPSKSELFDFESDVWHFQRMGTIVVFSGQREDANGCRIRSCRTTLRHTLNFFTCVFPFPKLVGIGYICLRQHRCYHNSNGIDVSRGQV